MNTYAYIKSIIDRARYVADYKSYIILRKEEFSPKETFKINISIKVSCDRCISFVDTKLSIVHVILAHNFAIGADFISLQRIIFSKTLKYIKKSCVCIKRTGNIISSFFFNTIFKIHSS